MNRIVCEACGSTDIVKQDGLFVCQYCGCKYTVEEIKKILIEGSIKVDESEKVKNWYRLAEDAYANSNWNEAYLYYLKVLEVRPDDWVSTAKKGLALGWKSSLADIKAREISGGIKDGKRLLMNAPFSDSEKADGIMYLAALLYNLIGTIADASAQHFNEFKDTSASACVDFYTRNALLSELSVVFLDLFDEYIYNNVSDIQQTYKLLDLGLKLFGRINKSLTLSFRPKVGKKYDTFLQMYKDVYQDIQPTEVARQANIQLSSKINQTMVCLEKWKEKRNKEETAVKLDAYYKSHIDIYNKLLDKKGKLKEIDRELLIKRNELSKKEKMLEEINDKCEILTNDISFIDNNIKKNRKKWFQNADTQAYTKYLQQQKIEKDTALNALQPSKNTLEHVILTIKPKIQELERERNNTLIEINEIEKKAEDATSDSKNLGYTEKKSYRFKMEVDNIFTISGRGVAATGFIEIGQIHMNDNVTIIYKDGTYGATTIIGIEKSGKLIDVAKTGDNVGLLCKGLKRDQLSKGDILAILV